MTYDKRQLNEFIVKHFTDEELRILCAVEFRGIYDDFSDGWGKKRKVMELIGWCQRNGEEEKLLTVLQRERPILFFAYFAKAFGETAPDKDHSVYLVDATKVFSQFPEVRTQYVTGKDMIRIPAGEFFYGRSIFKKKLYLPEFWIAKTPVTNAEYARFVAETGYRAPKHWKGWLNKIPRDKELDHPVSNLNWYDAQAYADWASCQLPTKEEWEKAARGSNGFRYPWGDEWRQYHCNSFEAGIGGTSPVGQFSPKGDSPYGCVDMIGNIWEWTKQGRIRGGSFDTEHPNNTLDLIPGNPSFRKFDYGFRIVEYL